MTINGVRYFCQGDVADGVSSLGERYLAYPRSASAQGPIRVGAARAPIIRGKPAEILARLDPERDLGWRHTPRRRSGLGTGGAWPAHGMACANMGRARSHRPLAGFGCARVAGGSRARVCRTRPGARSDGAREEHRRSRGRCHLRGPAGDRGRAVRHMGNRARRARWPRALLTWLERDPGSGAEPGVLHCGGATGCSVIRSWSGRPSSGSGRSEEDPLARLPAEGRIAVLLADTARAAMRVDSALAERARSASEKPMDPRVRRSSRGLTSPPALAGASRRLPCSGQARARGLLHLGLLERLSHGSAARPASGLSAVRRPART